MFFQRPARREPRVDITSLIDVAFLLIIFLVVTTTFLREQALDLDLPRVKGAGKEAEEALTVEVSPQGEMLFKGNTYGRDELTVALRQALSGTEDKNVFLRADRRSSHGDVVQAMDAIREAGAAGIRIAVEQKNAVP